jgi:hypothetical protein
MAVLVGSNVVAGCVVAGCVVAGCVVARVVAKVEADGGEEEVDVGTFVSPFPCGDFAGGVSSHAKTLRQAKLRLATIARFKMATSQSGMLLCFLGGLLSRLSFKSSSERCKRARSVRG